MERPRLDVGALIAALNAQREAEKTRPRGRGKPVITHENAARQAAGRQHLHRPDALVEHPAERFMTRTAGAPNAEPHPLAVASTLLRGKWEMTPKALKALDGLMQAAFKFSREIT